MSLEILVNHKEPKLQSLAMAAAREWSNCAVPVEYYETPTEWVFNVHFVDLERGFTVSQVFRKKRQDRGQETGG